MNLLETYAKRLEVAEKVYSSKNLGESLSKFKKIATAKMLENTNRFLNEAFDNSVGTQRADMGNYKKFTMNLVTVAVPNLISYDLVIVYPMSSISGYITYLQYTAGTNKGTTAQGDVFNDPFRLGRVDKDYTSSAVVETFTGVLNQTEFTLSWTPATRIARVLVEGTEVEIEPTTAGVVTAGKVQLKGNKVTFGTAPTAGDEIRVAYEYDNVVIPQNDLPIVNAKLQNIALTAKARRIAVYYSQIAAFQAKTDYGFDLGDQLAEKAVGQLQYEIDTEVTTLLINTAQLAPELVWSKTLPVGVSKQEHYAGFTEIIEIGKQKIYDLTKRFAPNYMLIASNVLPILTFIPGFKAAAIGSINGPYLAGTLNGLKVFVTPNIEPGKFVLGVNGDDMQSSAAVYAPYMPIVPTQLLGYADGAMSQGFSTMYDLKILNPDLLVAGRITA